MAGIAVVNGAVAEKDSTEDVLSGHFNFDKTWNCMSIVAGPPRRVRVCCETQLWPNYGPTMAQLWPNLWPNYGPIKNDWAKRKS